MDEQNVPTDERMDSLSEMLKVFNRASLEVMDYYHQLEKNVEHLSNELDQKNKELSKKVTELEQTWRYINNILESISDGVIATDLQGEIRTCNRAALAVLEYLPQEIVGKSVSILLAESKILKVQKTGKQVINFSRSGYETNVERKDGEKIPVVLFSSPITDEQGSVIGAVFTFKDVTLIKKLEDEIARSSRLASIGEMAAGVAHEIRNPLGGIEMFASILLRDVEKEPSHKRMLENILEGTRSINKIVSELLNFTRSLNKTSFEELDITEVVRAALVFAEVEIKQKAAEVVTLFDCCDEYRITGDADQLKQLFLNLFLNSAHALPEKGGKIEVRIYRTDGKIAVTVTDNGKGIAKEYLPKIFDPFFTTKAKGNGLGLAVSHRIVEAHNGTIAVKSRPGRETTFTVSFTAIDK